MKRTAVAASALALANGNLVTEYQASFDAVPRAMRDDGALLSGYGMKGTYQMMADRGLIEEKEILLMKLTIQTPSIKNLYYYQSWL